MHPTGVMTDYATWDSKSAALVREAEEEEKREKEASDRALGLEGGPKGPTTAKAEAELKELGHHSKSRQEFISWSKGREVSLNHSAQEEAIELLGPEVDGKAVRLSGSEGVTYRFPTDVVKIMVDNCRRVCIRVQSTIRTSTIELYSCSDVDLHLSQPLGTLQVDECVESVRVFFSERDHVGCIYHQNSPGLSLCWGDASSEAHAVGAKGAVQLCTRMASGCAKDPLVTAPVRRGEGEFPLDLPGGAPEATNPACLTAGPPELDAEERRKLAEQRRQGGNDMFRANDFMQATVHYTEALQLDPTLGAVWANRAQCWLKLGNPEKALEDAVQCTQVDPTNPKGWFRKGMSLHAMKRYPEAIPALLEAEKLEPNNKQVVDAIKMAQLMARKAAAGA